MDTHDTERPTRHSTAELSQRLGAKEHHVRRAAVALSIEGELVTGLTGGGYRRVYSDDEAARLATYLIGRGQARALVGADTAAHDRRVATPRTADSAHGAGVHSTPSAVDPSPTVQAESALADVLRQALEMAERRATEAREQIAEERAARKAAEQRIDDERDARKSAEERLRQAETQLRRARAEGERWRFDYEELRRACYAWRESVMGLGRVALWRRRLPTLPAEMTSGPAIAPPVE